MNKKKALLIIDMVQLYVYELPLVTIEHRDILISNIKKAIKSAHKNQIPVIYINSSFRKNDPIFSLYINYRKQAMEGEQDSEIIDELKPEMQDYVLLKRGFDAFWKSGLEKLLETLQIEEIYLTGLQTDCAVRETAVTAAHMGYIVNVIEDCCQTNRQFGQVAAIRFLSTCIRNLYYLKDVIW